MAVQHQITWRDIEPSDAVNAQIEEKIGKLTIHYDRIISCRVVVSALHRHRNTGKHYQVRVDVAVPGGEIVVDRDPGGDDDRADLSAAVEHAFDALVRRLQDFARRQRGDVKTHGAA